MLAESSLKELCLNKNKTEVPRYHHPSLLTSFYMGQD